MTLPDIYVPAGSSGHGNFTVDIDPQRAGWAFSGLRVLVLEAGLRVLVLEAGAPQVVDTGDAELLVLPLAGGATVEVDGHTYELEGRRGVFSGVTDYLYVGRGKSLTITSAGGGRFAFPSAIATRDIPTAYYPKSQVRVDLRGAGDCSRQVNNYSLAVEGVTTSHLLACEVITPGGNWSSYPPHKHDEHTETERVLEEIYYFEIREGGLTGSDQKTEGFGLQRVYDSPGHPIDVCTEVRSGDTVIVPHGYHGPSAAAPGYDMYYLNVMGGPAEDSVWLMTDDPVHTWMRQEWEGLDIDERVPFFPIKESEVK